MSKFRSFSKEMKKRLSTDVKGFTLIEVIVVLVILAILMAIAIPNVLGYINKAKGTENELTARNIYMAANVESAEILKESSSITADELTRHIDVIKSLSNIESTKFTAVEAATGTIPTAGDATEAVVTIVVKDGLVNGVQYIPAGDTATTSEKSVCYYADGSVTRGVAYDTSKVNSELPSVAPKA